MRSRPVVVHIALVVVATLGTLALAACGDRGTPTASAAPKVAATAPDVASAARLHVDTISPEIKRARGLAVPASVRASIARRAQRGAGPMLNVVGGDPSSPPTVTAIPFAPEPKPTANVGPTCDDCDLEGVPLGFSFNFFGQTFTSINISSNGFLSFTDNYSWCCAGEVLPSWSAPQNLIAVAWMDWYPLGDENGTITYETRGTAPDRRFIVQYDNVAEVADAGRLTAQVILYETSNVIEIHTTTFSAGSHSATQGVQNGNASSAAFLDGRAGSDFVLNNDAVRFTTAAATNPNAANQAPVAVAGGPYEVNEGDAVVLNASASSDPDGDQLSFAWDLDNDGEYDDGAGASVTMPGLADNGSFTVGLRVTDARGAVSTTSATVTVDNVAPTFDLAASVGRSPTVHAGVPFTIDAPFTDPGVGDGPWTYTIDWKDVGGAIDNGSLTSQSAHLSGSHVFQRPGTYTIEVTLRDKDGGVTTHTADVVVDNRIPVAAFGAPAGGVEGTAVVFDGSASSDPDNDAIVDYAWDFGDGSTGAGATAAHAYADNGSYAVTLVVTDARGAKSAAVRQTVAVANAAPALDPIADATVAKRTAYQGTATFSDRGVHDAPWSYTIDWDGDGVADESGQTSAPSFPLSHQYDRRGSYVVTVTLRDKDGGASSQRFTITVANRAPVITSDGGPYASVEGALVGFSAVASDPDGDPLTYSWNFGDPAVSGGGSASGSSASHSYPDDDSRRGGLFMATLTVTDNDGQSTSRAVPVDVRNGAPTVTGARVAERLVLAGASVATTVSGITYSDPGAADAPFATAIDCGNGTRAVAGRCSYADVGAFSVAVTVTDKDGGTSAPFTRTVRVVWPWGGFSEPVADAPAWNSRNAGSAVPLKFSLGGNRGLDIFADGYPASRRVSCTDGSPMGSLVPAETSGHSALKFEHGGEEGRYEYVWKTEKGWDASCRELVLVLADGSTHRALFRMK